jgi:hypothetical protein
MSKHTPPPWHIIPNQNDHGETVCVCTKNGSVIATLVEERDGPLIVNAPEMHQVLTELLEWCRWNTRPTDPNSPHEILVRATAVLNKINTPLS